tara:strand:+ start:25 stop:237 length:213 start_codon:yes stop_codon:yes gene_type:complete
MKPKYSRGVGKFLHRWACKHPELDESKSMFNKRTACVETSRGSRGKVEEWKGTGGRRREGEGEEGREKKK